MGFNWDGFLIGVGCTCLTVVFLYYVISYINGASDKKKEKLKHQEALACYMQDVERLIYFGSVTIIGRDEQATYLAAQALDRACDHYCHVINTGKYQTPKKEESHEGCVRCYT